MTALRQSRLLTADEYLAYEASAEVRHEYLGGYVYAMAGASNNHNRVAGNILAELHATLRGKPCEPFNSDTKVRVQLSTHTRFYYPDAMVVCDPNPGEDSFQDRPVIVAEVLSDSTRRTDEGEKRDAYLSMPSLRVYLLVEQDTPSVRVYRRVGSEFVMEEHEGLDAIVPLPEVESSLSLRDVYARVTFSPVDE